MRGGVEDHAGQETVAKVALSGSSSAEHARHPAERQDVESDFGEPNGGMVPSARAGRPRNLESGPHTSHIVPLTSDILRECPRRSNVLFPRIWRSAGCTPVLALMSVRVGRGSFGIGGTEIKALGQRRPDARSWMRHPKSSGCTGVSRPRRRDLAGAVSFLAAPSGRSPALAWECRLA